MVYKSPEIESRTSTENVRLRVFGGLFTILVFGTTRVTITYMYPAGSCCNKLWMSVVTGDRFATVCLSEFRSFVNLIRIGSS